MNIDLENGGGIYHIQNLKNGNDFIDLTIIIERIINPNILQTLSEYRFDPSCGKSL